MWPAEVSCDHHRRGVAALIEYQSDGDPAVLDTWGAPLVLQRPTAGTDEQRDQNVRLVSAGPNGVLEADPAQLTPTDLTTRGDDLVLFLFVPDV